MNYEGIVSKRIDAPYRSERVEAWLKDHDCPAREIPVVGFIKDTTGVVVLYLGKKERKSFVTWAKRHGLDANKVSGDPQTLNTVVSLKQKLTNLRVAPIKNGRSKVPEGIRKSLLSFAILDGPLRVLSTPV